MKMKMKMNETETRLEICANDTGKTVNLEQKGTKNIVGIEDTD